MHSSYGPENIGSTPVSLGNVIASEIKVEDLSIKDTIIAVMGPTGSGKSSFIEMATGVKGKIPVIKLSFPELVVSDICFVDTPDFDDTNKSDVDILKSMFQWLDDIHRRQVQLAGLLYFHPITGTPLKNLQLFERLCGNDFSKIVLTTTMCDDVDEETGAVRENELKTIYWKSMIERGSSVKRFLYSRSSAFEILIPLFKNCALLRKEMMDLHLKLRQTTTGSTLSLELLELVPRHQSALSKIRGGLTEPSHQGQLQNTVEEYERLFAELLHVVEDKRIEISTGEFDIVKPAPSETGPPNIIVFGQSGSGKSSLINMLAHKDVANVSGNSIGCTPSAQAYDISPDSDNRIYRFWDTPGLNEGDEGNVPARDAIDELRRVIEGHRLPAINLAIYCVRGQGFIDLVRTNYEEFRKIVDKRDPEVPILLVVTGLELEDDMNSWWKQYRKVVARMQMTFVDHACVTTIRGKSDMYKKEYQESTNIVWTLVQKHCKPTTHNVILFGEVGCGKSSIVNMILGKDVAQVSNSPLSCTSRTKGYETIIDGTAFCIYDTMGLNEGDAGRVPHWKAMSELLTLIWQLNGVSLLVCCMRGSITGNCQKNWNSISKIMSRKKVPIIAVVTGLEFEENLDDGRNKMMEAFKTHRMHPKDLACVVSFPGNHNQHKELYEQSQRKLRTLITGSHRRKIRWLEKNKWLGGTYHKAVFRPIPRFWRVFEPTFDVFVKEIGMPEGEADKLRETLRQSL